MNRKAEFWSDETPKKTSLQMKTSFSDKDKEVFRKFGLISPFCFIPDGANLPETTARVKKTA